MDKRRKRTKPEANVIDERLAFYAAVRAGGMTLAATVKAMRRVTGLTQPEYARLVGVAPRALIDVERGVANPTLETLEKIGRPFGLRVGLVPARDEDDR